MPGAELIMRKRSSSLLPSVSLAALVLLGASQAPPGGVSAPDPEHGVPPPQAAARVIPGDGTCIKFLSVFVPALGGHYVVGVSFAYRDLNGDGAYTPGVDKMDVCVNCADACGLQP